MRKIEYSNMKEEDAIKYFESLYKSFKRVINNDEKVFEYGFHFDWNNIEKRHTENLNNEFDEDERDYYFIDKNNKCEKYTLDISHDIDNFGYNDEYYKLNYKDIYDNLYCCSICAYRKYYEYDDIYLEFTFIYDKKEDKLVDILELNFVNPLISNTKKISHVTDRKVFQKIISNI